MGEMTHAQRVDSNRLEKEYFDSLMIRYRYIDSVEPDLTFSIFGKTFATPIFNGGFGRHDSFHESGSLGFAKAVAAAGSLNFNGWISDGEVEAICREGIPTVRGIKPFADHDRIYQAIENDERCGATAVCMDIEHIFNADGTYCNESFGQLGRQTVGDLKGYVQSTKLPFILKGILTAEDAEKAVEIGAAAIIMTNHNNRFPSMVPPLVSLSEVKKAVSGTIPILVDGCIESGVEAYKALALGADAVLTCRPLIQVFSQEGPEGVTGKLKQMTAELAGCMANTCSAELTQIRPESIIKKSF